MESEGIPKSRENEYRYKDDDNSDNSISDTIYSRFDFIIFPSWENEHDSSPENKYDRTESCDEYDEGYTDAYDILETIIFIEWKCFSYGSMCHGYEIKHN